MPLEMFLVRLRNCWNFVALQGFFPITWWTRVLQIMIATVRVRVLYSIRIRYFGLGNSFGLMGPGSSLHVPAPADNESYPLASLLLTRPWSAAASVVIPTVLRSEITHWRSYTRFRISLNTLVLWLIQHLQELTQPREAPHFCNSITV